MPGEISRDSKAAPRQLVSAAGLSFTDGVEPLLGGDRTRSQRFGR